tara:strand:+ start:528 stop:932 length:405 start_codon:yes stop_codon:yes gene_type:complete
MMSRKKKDRMKPLRRSHNTPTNFLDNFDGGDVLMTIGKIQDEIAKYSHLPDFKASFDFDRDYYTRELDGIYLTVSYTETPEMVEERIRQEDEQEAERAERQKQAQDRMSKNNIPKTKAGKIALLKRLKQELGED